jgi:hypothetical protein
MAAGMREGNAIRVKEGEFLTPRGTALVVF